MHAAAYIYVSQFAAADPLDVIELGSLDINGSPRALFPNARYVGVDLVEGRGVDIVGDAATWSGPPADVVISCEVLEHTEAWPQIVKNCATLLRPGGRVILTAAGPGRAAHSAIDGGTLRPHEYYENVSADELAQAMHTAGFVDVATEEVAGDVRGTGVLP